MEIRTNKSIINDLTTGPLFKQLVLFTLPIAGANLLQTLYTIVDLWVVGRFTGSEVIAAVSTSGQIIMLANSIAVGMGNGGQVLVSQLLGAGERSRLKYAIGTLLSVGLMASLAVAAAGALGWSTWLGLMQTPQEALIPAKSYLLICCIGLPFVYCNGILCAIFRGLGNSRQPMYILGVSTGVNVVLDLLFVAVFRWSAAGAAAATVIAQFIAFVYAFAFLYIHREDVDFDFRASSFRIDPDLLKSGLRLGAPLVVMNTAIDLSVMAITAMVNTYGVVAAAVMGIGSKITNLLNVAGSSIMSADASMVAQNFAAGKLDRVRRTVWLGMGVAMGFFVVLGPMMLLFPVQIFSIFTSDADVLAMAPDYMKIAFWTFLSISLMPSVLALINGVGFTSLNLFIALLDGVVARIGLAILFGNVMGMGLQGYWWGFSAAGYVSVFLPFAYFMSNHWTKRKVLVKE